MQAEQFIYAHFNKDGLCLIQSENVTKLLTEQSVQHLFLLGKTDKTERVILTKFPTEQIIAYSYLQPQTDNHGRTVMYNHTIIISYDDIFRNYQNIIEQYFIRGLDKPPKKLEPLKIDITVCPTQNSK